MGDESPPPPAKNNSSNTDTSTSLAGPQSESLGEDMIAKNSTTAASTGPDDDSDDSTRKNVGTDENLSQKADQEDTTTSSSSDKSKHAEATSEEAEAGPEESQRRKRQRLEDVHVPSGTSDLKTSFPMSSSPQSPSSSSDKDDEKQQQEQQTPQPAVTDTSTQQEHFQNSNRPQPPSPPTTELPVQERVDSPQPQSSAPTGQPNIHRHDGWRVKLYRLNELGSWDDCGTGRILCLYKQPKEKEGADNVGEAWIYQELGEPTLCMHSEMHNQTNRILLRTRILLRDAYQRQGDNIITWSEPCFEEGNPTQGVDLALSFQDNAGCLDIWRQITQVQSRAADLFRRTHQNSTVQGSSSSVVSQNSGSGEEETDENQVPEQTPPAAGGSVAEVAHAVAAAHHAKLQRQQQQDEMNRFYDISQAASQHRVESQRRQQQEQAHFEDPMDGMATSYQDTGNSPQLPNPPSLGNLEEIADMIAAVQVRKVVCLFA